MKRITLIFAIAATAAAMAGCAVYPDGTPAYGGGYAPGYDPAYGYGYGYGYGAAPVPQSNVYLGFGGYSGPSYYDHGYGRGYDRGYDRDYNHGRPPPPQQQGHGGGPAPQAGNGWHGGTPGAGAGHLPPQGSGQGSRGEHNAGRQSEQDYMGGGNRH
jgi:hypothetical protein